MIALLDSIFNLHRLFFYNCVSFNTFYAVSRKFLIVEFRTIRKLYFEESLPLQSTKLIESLKVLLHFCAFVCFFGTT